MKKQSYNLSHFLIIGLITLLLAIRHSPAQETSGSGNNGELESTIKKADEIVSLAQADNVAAGKKAAVIFAAANALKENGQLEKALQYYKIGLQVSPWSMDEQMNYAETLLQLNHPADAKEAAKLVYDRAEKGDLITRSEILLGIKPPEKMELISSLPVISPCVVFVPVGKIDPWLLEACGARIRDYLGVKIYCWEPALEPPREGRSVFGMWCKELRENLNWEHPAFLQAKSKLKISGDKSTMSDEDMVRLNRFLVKQFQSEEAVNEFDQHVFNLLQAGIQWPVDSLLARMETELPISSARPIAYVALMSNDIYGGKSNYVFGSASNTKVSAVSACHFYAESNAEPPDEQPLLDRMTKQLLSSIGFSLGIPRPTDPTSARAYSSGLEQVDSRTLRLSPGCITGFEAVFGRSLPQSTKER